MTGTLISLIALVTGLAGGNGIASAIYFILYGQLEGNVSLRSSFGAPCT